jgi:hypothetical protein
VSESSTRSEAARDDEAARRLEMAARALSLIYAIIVILFFLWSMIPEHRKRLMMMRLAQGTQRNASRAASLAGHQAMGLELSGHGERYELPYRLSIIAGKAGKAYDQMRYVQ